MAANPAVAAQQVHTAEKQTVLPGQSYTEYLAAVEENPLLRVEYLDGMVIMSAAPRPIHQIVVENLMLLLGSYIRQQRLGRLLPAPLDVALRPGERVVQPDLVFIAAERVQALIGETQIMGAPDLVVEVLSPATAHTDRHRKLPRYAQSGVGEYWLVDPEDQVVEVYLLDDGSYRVAGFFLAGERVDVGRFAAAGIAVDEVFAV